MEKFKDITLNSVCDDFENFRSTLTFIKCSVSGAIDDLKNNVEVHDYSNTSNGFKSVLEEIETKLCDYFTYFDNKSLDSDISEKLSDLMIDASAYILEVRDVISFIKFSMVGILSTFDQVDSNSRPFLARGFANVVQIADQKMKKIASLISKMKQMK